jgi:hypothetical protein
MSTFLFTIWTSTFWQSAIWCVDKVTQSLNLVSKEPRTLFGNGENVGRKFPNKRGSRHTYTLLLMMPTPLETCSSVQTHVVTINNFFPPQIQQGCQMVYFQTKNPILSKFRRALDWKMLIHFTAIWNILRIFGIFYDHLVHLCSFGTLFQVLVSCTKKNLATLIFWRPGSESFGTE